MKTIHETVDVVVAGGGTAGHVAEEEAVKARGILHYHEFIAEVKPVGNRWEIVSLGRGIRRITKAKEIIDCTGDSDVVRILGLGVLTSTWTTIWGSRLPSPTRFYGVTLNPKSASIPSGVLESI